MIIIWGTKVNQEPRGTVADKCHACREIELFAVTDHYEVSHIYYIGLGRGTRIATTRACLRCGTEYHCEPDYYEDYLAFEDAERLPIGKVISRTNRRLAEARAARQRLEDIATEPNDLRGPSGATDVMAPGTPLRDVAPSALDAELRDAVARLEPYEALGPEVTKLMHRLGNWRTYDAQGRTELLREVNAFIDQQLMIDRAIAFLTTMAQSFPQYAGCLPAIGLFLLLGAAFLLPIDWDVCMSIGYIIIGLVGVGVLYYWLNAKGRRQWYRTFVIPQADGERVDLQTLVSLMIALAASNQPLDEKVRSMCADANVLREEVAATHGWDMSEDRLEKYRE